MEIGVEVGRRNTKWALVWGEGRDTGKALWSMKVETKAYRNLLWNLQ